MSSIDPRDLTLMLPPGATMIVGFEMSDGTILFEQLTVAQLELIEQGRT